MTERQKVVEYALSQVGTAENPLGSNKQKYGEMLDKTNWYLYRSGTKTWVHKVNGYDWCTQFVDSTFIINFSIDRAREMLGRPEYNNYGAVVKYAYNYFYRMDAGFPKASYNPKPGDVIYFQNDAGLSHTGIVVGVSDTTVTTVEGNSGRNGCYVAKKTYNKTSSYIYGYGCPKYKSEEYEELNGYKVGNQYKVIVDDLMIRSEADKDSASRGKLNQGDVIGCEELTLDYSGNTWLRHSSGWSCGLYGDTRYISDKEEPKQSGWVKDGDYWRYYDKDGQMVRSDWIKYKGAYYYIGAAGVMLTGWQDIDGHRYYFREQGDMVSGEWIDGYAIDASGEQKYIFRAEWQSDEKGKWYRDGAGLYPRNKTVMIDGKACRFDKNGYLIT